MHPLNIYGILTLNPSTLRDALEGARERIGALEMLMQGYLPVIFVLPKEVKAAVSKIGNILKKVHNYM